MTPQEKRAPTISKWKGIWKDDKDRFVEIEHWETPEGLSVGCIMGIENPPREHYKEGNNVLDGSKLMERKRGEEKGWPR
jgi:hypothetical protein